MIVDLYYLDNSELRPERERMQKTELAFIPAPGVGHLAPMVELAKVIASRDRRISVTVFIINSPSHSKLNSYTQSLLSDPPPQGVRFINLPQDDSISEYLRSKPSGLLISHVIEFHKPLVKDLLSSESTHRFSAFVLDFFCISFMDVAAEFGVPSYVFFTGSAGVLSLMFHLQSLQDCENRDITEFKTSDTELRVPGFVNPLPAHLVPSEAFDRNGGGYVLFLDIPRNMRKVKGILVNTFSELESHAMKYYSDDSSTPSVYAVGPVLNLKAETNDGNDPKQHESIMTWLDDQPPASVVFLCFGSWGAFEAEQVAEIATALDRSGHRFLWSLRRPPLKGERQYPTDYADPNDVLPRGFLDKTKDIGKVIGWAPQVAVLSHPAVGGFVSHCGWNSILESLWCGVPVATWPLYAEQQTNAFHVVKELGFAVEIKLGSRGNDPTVVTAEEIERGIKQLMEGGESVAIRSKVKAMGEKSRMAVAEGGSSFVSVGQFIEDVINGSSVEK